jgi:hypothetical protein
VAVLTLTGCDRVDDHAADVKRIAALDAERASANKKWAEEFATLRDRLGAVEFPPKEANRPAYTIEIQDSLARAAGKPIIFAGFVDDVARTRDGVRADFRVEVGRGTLIIGTPVLFRLMVSPEQEQRIAARPRVDEGMVSRTFQPTNAIVVAKIDRAEPARYAEDRDGESDISRGQVAMPGVLVTGTVIAVEVR